MSLFSKQLYTPVAESAVSNVTKDDVYEAMMACNEGVNQVINALYITDVMMESGMIPVSEANVSDTLRNAKNKIIKFFKDLWAKISGWFKNVFEKLKMLFTGQKNFVTKYGSQIDEKIKKLGSKKITYKVFYDYGGDTLRIPGMAGDITKTIATYVKQNADNAEMKKSDVQNEIVDKVKSAGLLSKNGVSSDIETMADLKRALKDNLVRKEENYEVGASTFKTMKKWVTEGQKDIANVKALFNVSRQAIDAAIKTVDGGADATAVKVSSQAYNAAVAANQAFSDIFVEIITARNKYAYSTLKALVMGNKVEKVTEESATSFDSIFDAM